MNDIIEALEAKRAAARAGGGEKRHAAQHAKGKQRVVALALALFVLISASNAVAEGDWIDPTGRMTIRYREAGWRIREGTADGNVLSLEMPSTQRDRRDTLYCGVFQGHSPAAGAVQALANDRTQEINESQAASIFGSEVSEFQHINVDGIAGLSFTRAQGGNVYQVRVFALVIEDAVESITLSCGTVGLLADSDREVFDAFFDSVQFLPQR